MQAKHRWKPSQEPIADKCDVADERQDSQKTHILGHERQEHHRRGPVANNIVCGHGVVSVQGISNTGSLSKVPSGSREAGPKKLGKDCELG